VSGLHPSIPEKLLNSPDPVRPGVCFWTWFVTPSSALFKLQVAGWSKKRGSVSTANNFRDLGVSLKTAKQRPAAGARAVGRDAFMRGKISRHKNRIKPRTPAFRRRDKGGDFRPGGGKRGQSGVSRGGGQAENHQRKLLSHRYLRRKQKTHRIHGLDGLEKWGGGAERREPWPFACYFGRQLVNN
jgi:hypothetical protein